VGVINPDDESIVATYRLFDEYTIGDSLLVVGNVVGINGVVSVNNRLLGTTNDAVFRVFVSKTKPTIEPASNQID
jgi:hypothetical protein